MILIEDHFWFAYSFIHSFIQTERSSYLENILMKHISITRTGSDTITLSIEKNNELQGWTFTCSMCLQTME